MRVLALAALGVWSFAWPRPARALSLSGLDGILNSSDPTAILGQGLANGFVTAIGLITDDREYLPAGPLGSHPGLDIGIEATLVKIPSALTDAAVGSSGVNLSSLDEIPALPMAKVHLHKGIGDRLDVGGSFIFFEGYEIVGGDAKYTLYMPGEDEGGLDVALKLSYNYVNFPIQSDPLTLDISTQTVTPGVLFGRRVAWAEPYFGVGYQYAWGKLALSGTVLGYSISLPPVTGTGGGTLAWMGCAFDIPYTGLRLTLEGAYSGAGATSMGAKFGFVF